MHLSKIPLIMKNLELKGLGVQEMNDTEMKQVQGSLGVHVTIIDESFGVKVLEIGANDFDFGVDVKPITNTIKPIIRDVFNVF